MRLFWLQRTLLMSVLVWCLSLLEQCGVCALGTPLAGAEQELEAAGVRVLPGELGDCAGSVL